MKITFGSMGRRKSDNARDRVLRMITALALASSTLSCYLAYKAIRAMDAVSTYALDAYVLGKKLGRQPDYTPVNPRDEQ